ncbi:YacL family protein [Oscillatoria sp. HE19RPO]|uniref:YacL family protein n=1 Tax=Oscillatoria sp. HE19RPO TaxID=2954806 RepID=UPI0020C2CAA6|nr:YacL family protein [Oscillatoria sp. HE19RPO]
MTEKACNEVDWFDQSSAHRRVLEFLTLDIQNSPEWVQQLLDQIAALETGELQEWTRSGNAYYLIFSPQTVTLENLLVDAEPIETISLQEFKEAVLRWQEQLDNSVSDFKNV